MEHNLSFADLSTLLDPEGYEQCGFLMGQAGRIECIWPTPSLRPSSTSYRIGREAWDRARERAAREGLSLLGSIHTHPDGPPGPSERDLWLSARLGNGGVRAVWHPRSGTLTIYDASGILRQDVIARPWWFRLIAPLFYA